MEQSQIPTQSKQQSVVAHLETLNYKSLTDSPILIEKFTFLYNKIHGTDTGAMIFEKEKFNFLKAVSENLDLQKCSSLSLYGCFLDVAVNGLSLEKGSKPLCYLLTRNAKKIVEGKEVWEKRAYMEVSPYGELVMRIRAGQVKHVDNPIIVYDGDLIRVGLDNRGKQTVSGYEAKIPRLENAKILGGFIRIERHDGSFEIPWIDVAEADRLRHYSNKQNKGSETEDKSNALYSSYNGQIDPGFFAAKIIKHAFKSYPKVKTGEFTELADEPSANTIDYGFTPTDKDIKVHNNELKEKENIQAVQEVKPDESFENDAKLGSSDGIQMSDDNF